MDKMTPSRQTIRRRRTGAAAAVETTVTLHDPEFWCLESNDASKRDGEEFQRDGQETHCRDGRRRPAVYTRVCTSRWKNRAQGCLHPAPTSNPSSTLHPGHTYSSAGSNHQKSLRRLLELGPQPTHELTVRRRFRGRYRPSCTASGSDRTACRHPCSTSGVHTPHAGAKATVKAAGARQSRTPLRLMGTLDTKSRSLDARCLAMLLSSPHCMGRMHPLL